MGRLSEAIYMINASPEEWNKYSKTYNKDKHDGGSPFYIHYNSRHELKRLRSKYRNKQEISCTEQS